MSESTSRSPLHAQQETRPAPAIGIDTRWLLLPKSKGIVYAPSGGVNAWFLAT